MQRSLTYARTSPQCGWSRVSGEENGQTLRASLAEVGVWILF